MTRGHMAPAYWIKVRTRETHEHEIHGGFKRGSGRRRVQRWSKWGSHRSATSAQSAIEHLAIVRKLYPLSEVAVFYAGRRVTDEQLDARKRKEIADGEPCKACAARRAAGFDGLCPSCANERTRSEMRRG
jgi:hypothetical protein